MLAFACQLAACGAPEASLPEAHTLTYGGDVFVARRTNYLLNTAAGREAMFESDLEELFRRADLAMVNNEGVMAVGGTWFKPDPKGYSFHASPQMIEVYRDLGIDLVTVGNNHAKDYGPDALSEMLDRFTAAGIGYTGAGHNLADARQPVYRRLGDTVVAVVGADLTYARRYRALKTTPGTHYYRGLMYSDSNDDEVVHGMKKVLADARKYAHVVLLSPHWETKEKKTTPQMRALARRLLELGFDGILAHSQHRAGGVEIFAGKPVVYDAGNLLIDYSATGDTGWGMVWEVTFSRAGVSHLAGYPVVLARSRSALATGRRREKLLASMLGKCEALGTPARVGDGAIHIELDAGGIEEPTSGEEPPSRALPASGIREAPRKFVLDALPSDAVPLDVEWENGVRLIGYSMVSETIRGPVGPQIVRLYWTASRPQRAQLVVHLEAIQHDLEGREIERVEAHHLPGDWLLPASKWPVGSIVEDATFFRLLTDGTRGPLTFFAGLRDQGADGGLHKAPHGEILVPTRSGQPLVEGTVVQLGDPVRYDEGAPIIGDAINNFDASRHAEYRAEQPW